MREPCKAHLPTWMQRTQSELARKDQGVEYQRRWPTHGLAAQALGIPAHLRSHCPALRRLGLAARLRRGTRSYPGHKELEKFGRDVCGVQTPSAEIEQIIDGMREALQLARHQTSIPPALRERMTVIWDTACQHV